jgi:hypothetical protein
LVAPPQHPQLYTEGLLPGTIPSELGLLISLTALQLGMFFNCYSDFESSPSLAFLLKESIDTDPSLSFFFFNLSCPLLLAAQNAFQGTIPLELGRLTNLQSLYLGRSFDKSVCR